MLLDEFAKWLTIVAIGKDQLSVACDQMNELQKVKVM